MTKPRICIALGDGGLDSKHPFMDLYILAQAKKQNPKVCLLPTASGDNMGIVKYFYQLFDRYPCETSHLTFFNPHTRDIEDFLLSQDVIFVSGGHSKSMMGVWKEWGADKFLKKAYNNGTILSGGSAGSVCWFEQCITDSFAGNLSVMNCLGFLPYSNCPHFISQTRKEAYAHFVSKKEIVAGYAADDYAGLHFENEILIRSVSTRRHSKTYYFEQSDDKTIIKKNKTYFLGSEDNQYEFIWNTALFPEQETISSPNQEEQQTIQNEQANTDDLDSETS